MNALQSLGVALCCTCVAVSIISLFVPQKRTRRVMGFVIGLFFIGTIASAAAEQVGEIDYAQPSVPEVTAPTYSEYDYKRQITQMTADRLVEALNELLQNEGIVCDDIQLTLKISDEGRITVARAVIYINEAYRSRTSDIESIVYRNIAKEPEVYVKGEEPQRPAER